MTEHALVEILSPLWWKGVLFSFSISLGLYLAMKLSKLNQRVLSIVMGILFFIV